MPPGVHRQLQMNPSLHPIASENIPTTLVQARAMASAQQSARQAAIELDRMASNQQLEAQAAQERAEQVKKIAVLPANPARR